MENIELLNTIEKKIINSLEPFLETKLKEITKKSFLMDLIVLYDDLDDIIKNTESNLTNTEVSIFRTTPSSNIYEKKDSFTKKNILEENLDSLNSLKESLENIFLKNSIEIVIPTIGDLHNSKYQEIIKKEDNTDNKDKNTISKVKRNNR
jgi:hypothetical protein